MSDYFIDLVAGTNGDGSSGSPWNQFTVTENVTISGGDNLWFRRCAPSVGTKLISWLAGPDDANRINYIGWPADGDTYFNSRDMALAATWDLDSTTYTYQRKNDQQGTVSTLVSSINIHRFLFQNTQTGYSNYPRVLDILTQDNISAFNCYVGTGAGSPAYNDYAYARVFRIQNSTNIKFTDCYCNQASHTYALIPWMFYLYQSEVIFDTCTFILITCSTSVFRNSYFTSSYVSQVIGGTASWLDCDINFNVRSSSPQYSGSYNTACIWAKSDAFVTVSGCAIGFNTCNESTTTTLPSYAPTGAFGIENSVLRMHDTEFTTPSRNSCLLTVTGQSDVTLNTIDMQMTAPCTTLVNLIAAKTFTMKNIYGTKYSTGKSITENSYLISFRSWELLEDAKVENIQDDLGYLLDTTRTGGTAINITKELPLTRQSKIMVTSVSDLKISDSVLKGIVLYNLSGSNSRYVYGGWTTFLDVVFKDTTFIEVPLELGNSNSYNINMTIKYCDGTSTIIEKGAYNFTGLKLIASRNTGFISAGTTGIGKDISSQTLLNTFDNGATVFKSNLLEYKTSAIFRTGGSGYSVEIINNRVDGEEVTYPEFEQDTTWIHLDAPGTYNIKAFFAYTTFSGSVGAQGDVKLGVDLLNDVPVYNNSTTLSPDLTSTWNNTTVSGMFTATNTIITTKEQYCPVRVHYFRNIFDTKLFFDPKIEVTSV